MMKFEIDGNDGTGKSFRAAMLKRIFPSKTEDSSRKLRWTSAFSNMMRMR